ncbi:MAG: hypothetical protein KKF56_00935 [Nanoarchaeota archaeon]|nr:hypothetical protein [Nanoarchaeota archaeon]
MVSQIKREPPTSRDWLKNNGFHYSATSEKDGRLVQARGLYLGFKNGKLIIYQQRGSLFILLNQPKQPQTPHPE